jgi:hypothetical protein
MPLTPRTSQEDRPEATADRAMENRLRRRPPRKKSDWQQVLFLTQSPTRIGRNRVKTKMIRAAGWVSFW